MLKLYHVHTMDFSISRVYLEMMQFLIGCRNTSVTITTVLFKIAFKLKIVFHFLMLILSQISLKQHLNGIDSSLIKNISIR